MPLTPPQHAPDSPLAIDDVTVAYRRKPVLWDIDYDAPPRSLIGIIGPNGAGKSTLIKAVLGLVPILSGSIQMFGRPARAQLHRVGYVPQRETVDWDFPATALDVVLMGRYGKIGWFRRIGKAHKRAAMQRLEQVGMADFATRQIGQLSGGQQQRVFLARALAQEADLYLMDEPLAGVDAATERAIIDILRTLRNDGRTCLVVHHDLNTAADYFDHLLLLNMRVVDAGPTREVLTDENLRKTYGGRLTLLDKAGAAMESEPAVAGAHER
jgi:manganese/zinc/iron transport system ATP- binding protein